MKRLTEKYQPGIENIVKDKVVNLSWWFGWDCPNDYLWIKRRGDT